ncbi:MAG: hypothetical protein R2932_27690 [Caldilineaceae bacterium]
MGKAVATDCRHSAAQTQCQGGRGRYSPNYIGPEATIAIDAIRDHSFTGVVEQIDPINKSDKDVVNYPVTIRLTDSDLAGVRLA